MTALRALVLMLVADVKVNVTFFTRIPLPHTRSVDGGDIAGASWAAPLVGGLVGAVGAIVYAIALGDPERAANAARVFSASACAERPF